MKLKTTTTLWLLLSITVSLLILFPNLSQADEATTTDPVATTTDIIIEDHTPISTSTSTDQILETEGSTSTPEILVTSTTTEPTTTIRLKVQANDAELYNQDVMVHACQNSETGTTTTINGFCAIEQVAKEMGWTLAKTWYSFGVSIDGINEYISDFINNKFWLWFNSAPGTINPGATGLDGHTLTPNETLVITYNTSPLTLTSSTMTPEVGATTTLNAFYFDSNLWTLATATDSVLNINGTDVATSTTGLFDFSPSTTTPYSLFVHKAGSVSSESIILSPFLREATTTATTTPDNNTGGGGGGGGVTHNKINVVNAINFLVSKQHANGSYGADLYSDWVAIAFGSYNGSNSAKENLKDYITTNRPTENALLTDYERRAMALQALGVNPYNGTNFNYISKIIDSFDGTQFGDPILFNDDVFALIPLLHAGYTSTDQIIKTDVAFILSKQESNGSWDSVDLTSATIQALSLVSDLPNVSDAINHGKSYLRTRQQNDGGFGNSPATSWAVTALSALNPQEDIDNGWMMNNKNPHDYLASLQESDGGIESTSTDNDSRVWATAYSIPTGMGLSWNGVLKNFSKPILVTSSGGSSDALIIRTTTSTTTATSTEQVATTTPPALTEINAFIERTSTDQITLVSTTTPVQVIKKVVRPQTNQTLTTTITKATTTSNADSKPTTLKPKGFLAKLGLSMRDFLGNFYLGLGSIFGF